MALLIENAKFKNTEVVAPQIYARLQIFNKPSGKESGVVLLTGLNKEGALAYQSIATDLPEQILVKIPDGQSQDLLTIHELAKAELETKGFNVTIDLA
jgi:hypothetical protein